jgi:hypothetical protein
MLSSRHRAALAVALVTLGIGCSEEAQPGVQTSQGSGGTTAPTGGTGLTAGDGSFTGGTDGGGSGGSGELGGDFGFGGMPIGGAPGEGELLSTVTPDREAALCLQIEDYLNTPEVVTLQHEMDCRSAGFYATAGSAPATEEAARSMCQSTYDSCLASAMPTMIGDCVNATPACTATVGELFACWRTTPTQLMLALEGIPTCAVLTLLDLETTMRPSPPPSAACQSFDSKCPRSAMLPAP